VNISENIHLNTKPFHDQGISRWIPSLRSMYNVQHIFFLGWTIFPVLGILTKKGCLLSDLAGVSVDRQIHRM